METITVTDSPVAPGSWWLLDNFASKSQNPNDMLFSPSINVYIYIYIYEYICPKVENLFSCTGSCLHLFNIPTKGSCSSITPVEVSTGFVTAKKFPFSGLAEFVFQTQVIARTSEGAF